MDGSEVSEDVDTLDNGGLSMVCDGGGLGGISVGGELEMGGVMVGVVVIISVDY